MGREGHEAYVVDAGYSLPCVGVVCVVVGVVELESRIPTGEDL